MPYDKKSFLAGVALGRQLKGWATGGSGGGPTPPEPLSHYTVLDYISSSGAQYIDTCIYVKPTYTVSVTMRLNGSYTTWDTFFGTRDTNAASSGASRFTFRFHNTENSAEWQRSIDTSGRYESKGLSSARQIFQSFHQVGISNRYAMLDNSIYYTFDKATKEPLFPYTIYLFALHSQGIVTDYSHSDFKEGYILDETGNTLADYIPVQRKSDGAVGLFDKVTSTFMENSGTGVFTPHYLDTNNV